MPEIWTLVNRNTAFALNSGNPNSVTILAGQALLPTKPFPQVPMGFGYELNQNHIKVLNWIGS